MADVTVTLGNGKTVTVSESMARQMANNAASQGYTSVANNINAAIAAQTSRPTSSYSGSTQSNTPLVPAQTSASNSYQNNPNWIGNLYPDAKWLGNGLISTSQGILQEGKDFYTQNGRAYALPSLLSSYQTNIMMPGLTKTPLVPEIPEIPKLELPEYKPYEYRPYQQTAPLIPITSNPSDTVYTPTLGAINAWNEQEARNAEQAYQQYMADYNNALNAYKSDYDVWSTLLDNALQAEKLRQEYQLQEQERLDRLAQALAEAQAKAAEAEYDRAWKKYIEAGYSSLTPKEKELLGVTGPSLDERITLSNIAYRNRPSGSTSGGSKAPTKAQQEAEAMAYFQKYRSVFKRPIDMVEQVRRNFEAGKISKYIYDYVKKYVSENYDPYTWGR